MNFVSLIRTAFVSNLSAVPLSEEERAKLQSSGIAEPTAQRYALWRRATITMVIIATVLSAGVATYDYFTQDEDQADVLTTLTDYFMQELGKVIPGGKSLQEGAAAAKEKLGSAIPGASEAIENGTAKVKEKLAERDEAEEKEEGKPEKPEPKSKGEIVDDVVHLISLYTLPLTALIALLLGRRYRLSFRILVAGFLISFLAPMLAALCPSTWWEDADPNESALSILKGDLNDVAAVIMLLPSVLSLVPGIVKGCLRVKSLLPQSSLTGWLVVVGSPLYGMFMLIIWVAIDQVTTNPYILVGMALVTLSNFVYLFGADALTRPLIAPEDFARLKRVQLIVTLLTAAGGLVLLGYVVTREFNGIHLIGTDESKSLMRPIDIFGFVLETISRSMFVTALGVDIFLRMNLKSWKQNQALGSSPQLGQHNGALEAIDSMVAAR